MGSKNEASLPTLKDELSKSLLSLRDEIQSQIHSLEGRIRSSLQQTLGAEDRIVMQEMPPLHPSAEKTDEAVRAEAEILLGRLHAMKQSLQLIEEYRAQLKRITQEKSAKIQHLRSQGIELNGEILGLRGAVERLQRSIDVLPPPTLPPNIRPELLEVSIREGFIKDPAVEYRQRLQELQRRLDAKLEKLRTQEQLFSQLEGQIANLENGSADALVAPVSEARGKMIAALNAHADAAPAKIDMEKLASHAREISVQTCVLRCEYLFDIPNCKKWVQTVFIGDDGLRAVNNVLRRLDDMKSFDDPEFQRYLTSTGSRVYASQPVEIDFESLVIGGMIPDAAMARHLHAKLTEKHNAQVAKIRDQVERMRQTLRKRTPSRKPFSVRAGRETVSEFLVSLGLRELYQELADDTALLLKGLPPESAQFDETEKRDGEYAVLLANAKELCAHFSSKSIQKAADTIVSKQVRKDTWGV